MADARLVALQPGQGDVGVAQLGFGAQRQKQLLDTTGEGRFVHHRGHRGNRAALVDLILAYVIFSVFSVLSVVSRSLPAAGADQEVVSETFVQAPAFECECLGPEFVEAEHLVA